MKMQAVTAAIGLLIAGLAPGRDSGPDVDGFKAYEMPTYTIVTRDQSDARPLPRLAALIDGALAKLLNRGTPKPAAPTYVFLIPESVWGQYLQPGQGIGGEFVPARFANYVLLQDARDQSEFARGFFHEYTHWFLHTQYGGIQPLWFNEGLAEFVMSAQFRGSQVWLGSAEWIVLGHGWIPMQELLRMDKTSPEYRNRYTSDVVHSESWALVHRGLAAKPEFGKQMFAYLDAINRLEPVETAVQSSFGMSINDLDQTVHSYLAIGSSNSSTGSVLSGSYKAVRIPMDPVPVVKLPQGRAMAPLESLELIADIMLASGFNPDRLPEVANAMQRVAADSPSAITLRMRIAARAGDDATLERLLAGIAPTANDPKLLRGAGLALYERVGDPVRADFVARAFELLDRALMSRPDDAEAVWAYTVLAASLKRDLPTARRRIAGMSAILPSNPYFAQATALASKASGDVQAQQKALRDTLRLSKTPEMTYWAMRRLDLAETPKGASAAQ